MSIRKAILACTALLAFFSLSGRLNPTKQVDLGLQAASDEIAMMNPGGHVVRWCLRSTLLHYLRIVLKFICQRTAKVLDFSMGFPATFCQSDFQRIHPR